MQSQEIEEFDANGPTTCHSSLNDTLLAYERVSTTLRIITHWGPRWLSGRRGEKGEGPRGGLRLKSSIIQLHNHRLRINTSDIHLI